MLIFLCKLFFISLHKGYKMSAIRIISLQNWSLILYFSSWVHVYSIPVEENTKCRTALKYYRDSDRNGTPICTVVSHIWDSYVIFIMFKCCGLLVFLFYLLLCLVKLSVYINRYTVWKIIYLKCLNLVFSTVICLNWRLKFLILLHVLNDFFPQIICTGHFFFFAL